MTIGIGIFVGVTGGTRLPNLWDDTLATGDPGWLYNGDGTWTGTATSSDIFILNLTDVGSTAAFDLEIIDWTVGSIGGKNRGTVDVQQRLLLKERKTVTILDTSGFGRTGIESNGFTGTIKIHSVKQIIGI